MIEIKRAADAFNGKKSRQIAALVEKAVPYGQILQETGARRELVNDVIRVMYGAGAFYPGRAPQGGQMTLCWFCRRACGGCSWSQDFTPVAGWDAVPTKIKTQRDATTGEFILDDSFLVLACPEYEADEMEGRR